MESDEKSLRAIEIEKRNFIIMKYKRLKILKNQR